jgi:hypothetical protein
MNKKLFLLIIMMNFQNRMLALDVKKLLEGILVIGGSVGFAGCLGYLCWCKMTGTPEEKKKICDEITKSALNEMNKLGKGMQYVNGNPNIKI